MKNVPEKRYFPYVKTIIIFIFIILFVMCSVLYLYPVKYSEIISKYSKKYNLPEELIYAVINTESGFDKNEVSPKGARGLMQIM